MSTKNILKFLLGAGVIVLLGAAFLFIIRELNYRTDPEYQTKKDMEALERRYAEDMYGGDTPEETLQLFIDALKKEDIDLAAKYFVLDKQAYWRNELLEIKDRGLLKIMRADVEKLENRYPLIKGDTNRFIFETYNENNELTMQADLGKGPNGIWKIIDL